MAQLQKITVKGYKSIRSLVDFELRPLNILIGANGAGKSNFISLFRFLASVTGQSLQYDVQQMGGPNTVLHFGQKTTPQLELELTFRPDVFIGDLPLNETYGVTLAPSLDNRFIFSGETLGFSSGISQALTFGRGHAEAAITNDVNHSQAAHYADKLKSWRQYHFHDTSASAHVKGIHQISDNLRLKPDAANLAAYLRFLKEYYFYSYQRIVDAIRLAAPYFDNFVFRSLPSTEYMELEWTERGQPDTPWKAHVLSDGTLRFICLSTLLLQPVELLPDTILIDEPELGLHPQAIHLLTDMLHRASETNQVIVATQSSELVDEFEPEDVIAVDRQTDLISSYSTFKRLETSELENWLQDYSLGELWKRNILGGRPRV
jgi:predicted ATPase